MTILFSIIGALMLIYLIGTINSSIQFSKKVKTLFSQSNSISNQLFHKSQLEHLPDPVQRYFNLVLKERQPYISYASIKHSGLFKTQLDKGWINIKGEQYATTQQPGFIWKGTTAFFTALDMYIAKKGRLVVSLFSFIPIINGKGDAYNQGELIRWLGESVLYPTNLLTNERLQWQPIDSKTAKLTFNYNGLSLFFNIAFNQLGEITEMETERYMNPKKMETWVIKVSNYKLQSNILIPTSFEVLWRLEKGDCSYAKFDITEVVYNKPEKL